MTLDVDHPLEESPDCREYLQSCRHTLALLESLDQGPSSPRLPLDFVTAVAA